MALGGEVGTVPWTMKGELILNCNCTVFCPCVVSLGKHPPTEGHCQTWGGVRIDAGQYGDIDLSGLNVGLMIERVGCGRSPQTVNANRFGIEAELHRVEAHEFENGVAGESLFKIAIHGISHGTEQRAL